MAISRVTTWSSGQVLTASALNGEFNNILNNALSLISPLTGALNANGNDITSLDELTFSDGAAVPTTSGGLRRNGDALTWLLTGSHTNSVKNVAHLIANTSGTPAAGIGTGLLFSSESADEDPANVGALQFAMSDVGAGTEDSYHDILLRVAGAALATAYRFQATGAYKAILTHALATADRTYTLPDASTTLVGHDATQTLTNKTLGATSMDTNAAFTPAAVSGTPAAHAVYRENTVKGWAVVDQSSGTAALSDSFNVTSVTDGSTGLFTITWDRDFASANYAVVATGPQNSGDAGIFVNTSNATPPAAGTTNFEVVNNGNVAADVGPISIIAIGDQA